MLSRSIYVVAKGNIFFFFFFIFGGIRTPLEICVVVTTLLPSDCYWLEREEEEERKRGGERERERDF